ncbi:MAG TPA: hypothetical protein VFS10_03860 [Pyrinomonadaceae bacterium]|nr:hypothetical protein [Pyrinomonadaceae bacterium]
MTTKLRIALVGFHDRELKSIVRTADAPAGRRGCAVESIGGVAGAGVEAGGGVFRKPCELGLITV